MMCERKLVRIMESLPPGATDGTHRMYDAVDVNSTSPVGDEPTLSHNIRVRIGTEQGGLEDDWLPDTFADEDDRDVLDRVAVKSNSRIVSDKGVRKLRKASQVGSPQVASPTSPLSPVSPTKELYKGKISTGQKPDLE
eukprot:jgi/Chlat1/880/Chrsp107S01320